MVDDLHTLLCYADGSGGCYVAYKYELNDGYSLDKHNQVIILAIDLHLEDAHLLLSLLNLGPEHLLRMTVAILADEFSIVGDVEDLNVTLGGLIEFPDGCSLIHNSFYFYENHTQAK